ncbi:MAG: hypothetical protein K8I03_11295 [Ignavibacteria bacterium]|nr:hypothetical protein [Ignavibacteria bacterium]
MQANKTLCLLAALSSEEIKEFEKFVYSPFHNNHQPVTKLFDVIKGFHPEFSNKVLCNDFIFEKLYPNERFNYNKMEIAWTRLLELGEEYLSYKHYNSDVFASKRYLLTELSARKLDKLFELRLRETERMLSHHNKNEDYYMNLFLLNNLENSHYQFRKRITAVKQYGKFVENFFKYLLTQSLQIYLLFSFEKEVFNEEIVDSPDNLYFIDEVIAHIEQHAGNYEKNDPYIVIYFNLLMLLNTRQEKYFFKLKKLRDRNIHSMDPALSTSLYTYLTHFCTLMFKEKDKTDQFKLERFKLDSAMFKNGALPEEWPYMPSHVFVNIIRNSIRLNEYTWTKYFISQFESKLNPDTKGLVMNFISAMTEYSLSNVDLAYDYINKIRVSDNHKDYHSLETLIKFLKITLLYEKSKIKECFSLIEATKRWLQRDKELPKHKKKKYAIILNCFHNLCVINVESKVIVNKAELTYLTEKFMNKLESTEYFYEKEWIEKSIVKLNKSIRR